VRDRLLTGRPQTHDRDYLVTGISYNDLSRILNRFGQVNLVGRSFGVIKYTEYRDGEPVTFDISLPRTEHSTGVGHKDFEVKYDASLNIEDDLVRRDFTINAMALELGTNEIIDPLRGQKDLNDHLIRMVYPESFEDDPLRMLRAVAFAARFEFDIEESTFAAMKRHAALIETVSAERIADELRKLLERAERPSVAFRLMEQTGLLEHFLPELHDCVSVDQPGGYHAYDVFEHTLRTVDACPKRFRVRLAALFHDINKPQTKREVDRDGETGATFYGHEMIGARTAKQIMKRLRFSNELIRQISILVERHMFTTDVSDKGMRRLIRRVGIPLIFDLLDLRRADVVAQGMGGTTEDVDEFEAAIRAELDRRPPFSLRDLALDGGDLMRILSIDPGPKVGEILNYLLERVLDEPTYNSPRKLEELAKDYYDRMMNRPNDKGTDS
jgi:putative nucleotidyltransferase with HDIG domain